MILANDPLLTSFITVDDDHHFPIQNLPFGVFSDSSNSDKRVGVAIGDYVLDLAVLEQQDIFSALQLAKNVFNQTTLNAFMQQEKACVSRVRNYIAELLSADTSILRDNIALRNQVLIPMAHVTMHMPVQISGYTDFYSSKEHASNLGAMFRDKDNPLLPNWTHIPVAYDGRSSSIVVSGTDFHRPKGQIKPDPDKAPIYAPCRGMDVEVEMGMLLGAPSQRGEAIQIKDAHQHIFGMTLVNDWSARDIQKWEYVPLGPFLGKNFCTSISPWVVTLDALEPFRVASPKQDPEVLPYLSRHEDWGIDLQLELALQSKNMQTPQVISNMNFKHMYWDICQQLAHHSVNGCPMYTGDLLASGTISGKEKNSFGSLIELTWGGKNPIDIGNGETRTFLKDEDTAIIRGYCQGQGYRVGFGEVRGKVLAAN